MRADQHISYKNTLAIKLEARNSKWSNSKYDCQHIPELAARMKSSYGKIQRMNYIIIHQQTNNDDMTDIYLIKD